MIIENYCILLYIIVYIYNILLYIIVYIRLWFRCPSRSHPFQPSFPLATPWHEAPVNAAKLRLWPRPADCWDPMDVGPPWWGSYHEDPRFGFVHVCTTCTWKWDRLESPSWIGLGDFGVQYQNKTTSAESCLVNKFSADIHLVAFLFSFNIR